MCSIWETTNKFNGNLNHFWEYLYKCKRSLPNSLNLFETTDLAL